MAIYRISGDVLEYTAAAKTNAGTLVNVGAVVGVTQFEIAAGATGTIRTRGVFDEVPKYNVSNALTKGQVVYFDPTTGKIYNAAAAGRIACGYAVKAAEATDATCSIYLVNGCTAAEELEGSDSGSV